MEHDRYLGQLYYAPGWLKGTDLTRAAESRFEHLAVLALIMPAKTMVNRCLPSSAPLGAARASPQNPDLH
jgi:hypothetical protein